MELIDHTAITNYLRVLKHLEYEDENGSDTKGEKKALNDFLQHADRLFETCINEVQYLRLSKTYTKIFPRIKEKLRGKTEALLSSKKRKLLEHDHKNKLKSFKKNYRDTQDPKIFKAFLNYYKIYLNNTLEFTGQSYEEYLTSNFQDLPYGIESCRELAEHFLEKMWENGQRKHLPNLITLHKNFLIRQKKLFKYLYLIKRMNR